MNEELTKLKNRSMLTNKEVFTFLKLFKEITAEFASKLGYEDGPESEKPDEIYVRSSPKSVLTTSLAKFDTSFKQLEQAMNIPRKFVETEEMDNLNKLRLIEFGMIKKIIYGVYSNNKQDLDAQSIWFLIRIYKNLSLLKVSAVNSNLVKFVADMETDTYKSSCETLKINNLIASLKEKNAKFEQLLIKRSTNININYKSVKPFRMACEKDYQNTFNIVSSIVQLDPISDFSLFIEKINGYTSYYNTITSIKKTRRRTKKENEETDPEVPEMPVMPEGMEIPM